MKDLGHIDRQNEEKNASKIHSTSPWPLPVDKAECMLTCVRSALDNGASSP